MAKVVTVTIDDGGFSVDLTGFNGKGCDAVLKIFDGIGDKTKEITKPEFRSTQLNVVRK